jgi:hypothetical protein
MAFDRCDGKRGLLSRCKLEKLHAGDHDDGKGTWPRTGNDLQLYLLTLKKLDEMKKEREYMLGLAEAHERESRQRE